METSISPSGNISMTVLFPFTGRFSNYCVYMGIIVTMPSLAGNKYLSFTLGGLIELPAYILCFFIVKYVYSFIYKQNKSTYRLFQSLHRYQQAPFAFTLSNLHFYGDDHISRCFSHHIASTIVYILHLCIHTSDEFTF